MAITRSPSKTASSTLWVTKKTVLWVSVQSRATSCCSRARVCASSAAKGSSNEQNLRIVDQHARECRALAHAAGKLVGVPVLGACQPDHGQGAVRQFADRARWQATLARAVLDILT